MSSWIEEVLDATKDAESPKAFFYWSALAAISAVVKGSVYTIRYFGDVETRLYPNIYVLLIARSGLRKGFPVYLAKSLVTEVGNTRVISGRNSIQGIIKDLATTVSAPGRPPLRDACGFIISGEFSTVLIRDPEALTILTDLHDGHFNPEWKNTLKGSGVEELKGVNITLLGAMNQTHFKDMVTAKEITGGFIGRTMLVEENTRASKNPAITRPERVFDTKILSKYLKELSLLSGPFLWSVRGQEAFIEWYMKYEPEKREDKTGTANRMHDQVLKVAMLLSLSREPKLVLEESDIISAISTCGKFEKAAKSITSGHGGTSEFGPKIKMVMERLVEADGKAVKRSYLLTKHYEDMDAFDLDRVMVTLIQSGAAMERVVGKDQLYFATPELLESFKKFYNEEIKK